MKNSIQRSVWLGTLLSLVSGFGTNIFCAASETASAQSIGHGDGHIHIIPVLSAPSLKNGEKLTVSALVTAAAGVRAVCADLGGIETVQLQPSQKVNSSGEGLWTLEWTGHDLEEKVYTLTLRATDGSGHSYEDRSLQFSDPAAGITTAGSTNYSNGGLRRIAGITFPGSLGESEFYSAVIDVDKGYAYFGTWIPNAHIVKVKLNGIGPPTRVADLALDVGEDYLETALIDTAAGFAYFAAHTQPAKIIKIALGDGDVPPTKVGTLTLNAGEEHIHCGCIDTVNGYAYFGSSHDVGKIIKVALNGTGIPIRVASLTLNAGDIYPRCCFMDSFHGFAYFGMRTDPGRVVKVALGAGNAAPVRLGSVDLGAGEWHVNSAVFDSRGGFAYLGTEDGHVVKITLGSGNAPPVRIGGVALDPGERELSCAVLDAANGFACFGTTAPSGTPGTIVKVDLGGAGPPVRLGALQLNTEEEAPTCAVMDTNGYAYFGTATGHAHVIKIAMTQRALVKATKMTLAENADVVSARLYSHSASGNVRLAIYADGSPKTLIWESGSVANTILNDVIVVPISSGTPATLSLTPGTYWLAWQVDTTAAVPSTVSGNAGDGFVLDQAFGAFPASLAADAVTSTADRWTEYIVYHRPGDPPGTNSTPILGSSPSAAPNPARAGQSVLFSVSADDPEFDVLKYTWDFGDGTTGNGASTFHVFTAEGTYTAKVTVDDGNGGVVSANVSLVVISPTVGGGPDSDGDGFSDSFEIAAGSNPQDIDNTPLGNAPAGIPQDLTVSKFALKLNFAKGGNDSMGFSGTLPVRDAFAIAGQKVIVEAGGIVKSFTLDAKGGGKSGGDSFKIAIKAKKGVVAAQTAKYAVKLSKGTFADSLKDEGLTGDASVKSADRSIRLTVLFDLIVFQKQQAVKFSATTGKTGSAK